MGNTNKYSNVSSWCITENTSGSFSFYAKGPTNFLNTKTSVSLKEIAGGQYYYLGIEESIEKIFQSHIDLFNEASLHLQVNIDGLPLFKSSSTQFWPILGRLWGCKEPFIIALFVGETKPTSVSDYLHDFIEENGRLKTEGFDLDEKHFTLHVSSFICDTPARAYIKRVKSHSGYHGCDKCWVEGEWENKKTFPQVDAKLRNDEEFLKMADEDHHLEACTLNSTGIGFGVCVPA